MADEKKISELTESSDASSLDEFVVVNKDVVTGQDASTTGQTSKITLDNLRNSILGGSSGSSGNDVIFAGNVEIRSSEANQEALLLLAEGDNDSGGIEFSVLDSSTYKHTITHNDVGLVFDNNSESTTYRHYVFSNGNVGIGTASPEYKLHIAYDSNGDAPTLSDSNSGGFGIDGAHTMLAMGVNDDQTLDPPYYHSWIQARHKILNYAPTSAYNLALNPLGGNVGIGTSSPGARLHVAGVPVISGQLKSLLHLEDTQPQDVNGDSGGGISFGGIYNDQGEQATYGAIWAGKETTAEDGNFGGKLYLMARKHGDTTLEPDLTVDSNGNVGIGTTLPGNARLEIKAPNASNAISVYNEVDNDRKMCVHHYDNGGAISLYNDGVPMICIDGRLGTPNDTYFNSGNVGIGTSSPENPLHIKSGEHEQIHMTRDLDIRNSTNGAATMIYGGALNGETPMRGAGVGFSLQDTRTDAQYGDDESDTLQGYMYFSTLNKDDGFTERVRITPAGHVGIGVTNPGHRLNVSDGTVNFKINPMTDQALGTEAQIGTVTNHALKIQTNNVTRMTFDTNDNVGIATATPHTNLEVRDSTSDCIVSITSGSNAYYSQIAFCHDDGDSGAITERASIRGKYASNGGGQLDFYTDNTAGTQVHRMTIGNNGVVHVVGNLTTSGTASSVGFDADNLDNVRATEASGLDSINNLVVSDFEKDGVTKTGIVAQDMQKVLPQSVSGGDEYEAVAVEAEGRVVRGLGTDDEHEYCPSLKKSDFENPEHTWDETAEFVETKAEETETRNHSLATSNDELIATLVKAVQELSAKVDELSK